MRRGGQSHHDGTQGGRVCGEGGVTFNLLAVLPGIAGLSLGVCGSLMEVCREEHEVWDGEEDVFQTTT
jgi:hypothetical protein